MDFNNSKLFTFLFLFFASLLITGCKSMPHQNGRSIQQLGEQDQLHKVVYEKETQAIAKFLQLQKDGASKQTLKDAKDEAELAAKQIELVDELYKIPRNIRNKILGDFQVGDIIEAIDHLLSPACCEYDEIEPDKKWLEYVPQKYLDSNSQGLLNGLDCTGLSESKSKATRNSLKHMIWNVPGKLKVEWIWGSQAALPGCQGMSHVGKTRFLRPDLLKVLPLIFRAAQEDLGLGEIKISTTTTRFHSRNSKHYSGGAIDIDFGNKKSQEQFGEKILERIEKTYPAMNCQYIPEGHHLHFDCDQ